MATGHPAYCCGDDDRGPAPDPVQRHVVRTLVAHADARRGRHVGGGGGRCAARRGRVRVGRAGPGSVAPSRCSARPSSPSRCHASWLRAVAGPAWCSGYVPRGRGRGRADHRRGHRAASRCCSSPASCSVAPRPPTARAVMPQPTSRCRRTAHATSASWSGRRPSAACSGPTSSAPAPRSPARLGLPGAHRALSSSRSSACCSRSPSSRAAAARPAASRPAGAADRRRRRLRPGPRLGEPWAAGLAGIPAARLGLVTMALGHVVMVSVMVMTPLHMSHGDAGLEVIGLVISIHVFGMFAFSPLTGLAVDRFGGRAVAVRRLGRSCRPRPCSPRPSPGGGVGDARRRAVPARPRAGRAPSSPGRRC